MEKVVQESVMQSVKWAYKKDLLVKRKVEIPAFWAGGTGLFPKEPLCPSLWLSGPWNNGPPRILFPRISLWERKRLMLSAKQRGNVFVHKDFTQFLQLFQSTLEERLEPDTDGQVHSRPKSCTPLRSPSFSGERSLLLLLSTGLGLISCSRTQKPSTHCR